ncbi:hypothetical protein MSAN_01011900 [Mycena sanguinolenta]|uniref:F-box domain-containing protein n=1 Tax=Mycena sanguinolenta TaxID=230812 RepID=A0A8H7D990_9AGAR|nr:hypothetical protein MSAN_01011900 [Mycena sanguinolenta]
MSAVLLEQKERIRKNSKADVERFIEESESKISSFERKQSQINVVELRDSRRIGPRVATLRHLLSPIYTLSAESLSEIFELSIGNQKHIKDVLRISQVCSDWRQFAQSTPQLWTRPMEMDLRKCRSNDVEGYIAWILRAAPLTMPVSLLPDASITRHTLDGILKTAPRWRSLQLLDNLKELDLAGDFNEDEPTAFPSFSAVPRLRKLYMIIYSTPLPIILSCTQLTNLTFGTHFPNIAFNILA